jgi:hypothetical protein
VYTPVYTTIHDHRAVEITARSAEGAGDAVAEDAVAEDAVDGDAVAGGTSAGGAVFETTGIADCCGQVHRPAPP